jgi:sugar phosphate isomerase/epimerase
VHLSIITDEIAQSLEPALRVCQDLGVDTVELRGVDNTNIVFHDQRSLQRIKDQLDSLGLRVRVIDSPFLKSHFWSDHSAREPFSDFDTPRQQWAILERSFEVAHFFGASLVRTFSFWRVADPTSIREAICASIAEAVTRTEAAGLTLTLENEHACNIATGAETGWLLQQLPSTSFGITWDPGNEAAFGGAPFPEGYRHVRGRIVHVHIKDVSAQRRFVALGSGTIDYVNQLRALQEDGYDGLLSLETHYARPQEQGGQEQATRESFAALRTLCQQAAIPIE